MTTENPQTTPQPASPSVPDAHTMSASMPPAGPVPGGREPAVRGHRPLTVCGVIAVVFGALGLVLSVIPIVNNLAAILGFIGAVLAVVALVGTFRGRRHGKALSVVAAALCVLAIVVTLAMQAATGKAIDDAVKDAKGISTSQSAEPGDADAKAGADSGAKAGGAAAGTGAQDMEGDVEGAHVRIVSAVKSGNDYEGKPTVLVTYEWTNRTTKNNSFMALTHAQVFQNGRALDTAIYSENPAGYDAASSMAETQPGATATVTEGYVLDDDSPVDVEVSALFAVGDDSKVTHTFALG